MDETESKTVVKKITWHIIPFICVLYIINFLDRVNIGYAALTMNPDLGITPGIFGIISGIFFIGYIVLEIPSNRMLKRLGARIWIPRIMITWGLMVICIGFSRNAFDVGLFRFLLGAAEAGFFPGVMLYLSYWFRRKDLTLPVMLLYYAQISTVIFGGPLSSWIIDSIHWFGVVGWRWLFILEGMPALILGVIGYWILIDRPDNASWLSDDEKEWVSETLARENGEKSESLHTPILAYVREWWIHVFWFAYFMLIASHYVILFWLPQIVSAYGISRSHAETGLISSIPYILSLIGMAVFTWNSRRTGDRIYHLVAAMVLIVTGFVGDSLFPDPVTSLGFISLACMGSYIALPIFWAEFPGHLKGMEKAAGIALISCLGMIGGFAGPALVGAFVSDTGVIIRSTSFTILSLFILISIVSILYYKKTTMNRRLGEEPGL
jgi:ACS family tartrate transporter-like MFS transporter